MCGARGLGSTIQVLAGVVALGLELAAEVVDAARRDSNQVQAVGDLLQRRGGDALGGRRLCEGRVAGGNKLGRARDLGARELAEAIVGLEDGDAHVAVLPEPAELETTLREDPDGAVAPGVLERGAADEVAAAGGERAGAVPGEKRGGGGAQLALRHVLLVGSLLDAKRHLLRPGRGRASPRTRISVPVL